MTLIPELQAAVDRAQAGNLRGMHQMILGPSPSGKSTQARAYAKALAEKGVVGPLREIDISVLRFVHSIGDEFSAAKGGVLLIDELEKSGADQRREVLAHVVRAISEGDTLVIITGAVSLEKDRDMDAGLQQRMNKPIILDRQFTVPQMDAYNATGRDLFAEEKTAQAMRAQRIAEWKEAKTEDLRPLKPIIAPKTARFRKPQVPA